MFKFRGQRDGEIGGFVTGWWYMSTITEGQDVIRGEDGLAWCVKRETLSISTGKFDSTSTEIFASFPIDGVMTSGGDVVRMLNGMQNFKVVYDLHGTRFAIATMNGDVLGGIVNTDISYTIIGKGGGNDKS